jgi:hypothetical protein
MSEGDDDGGIFRSNAKYHFMRKTNYFDEWSTLNEAKLGIANEKQSTKDMSLHEHQNTNVSDIIFLLYDNFLMS